MGFVEHQADGMAILLWAAEPETPQRLMTPFFHAAAAAAMDLPVEIYFTARSVRLLVPGVAETLRASAAPEDGAGRDARGGGSRGRAAMPAPMRWKPTASRGDGLIAECTRLGGAVQFMARAADLRWRTLVY